MNDDLIIFEEILDENSYQMQGYTKDCTNASASACCTRVCSQKRNCVSIDDDAWKDFVVDNAGVIQY